MSFWITLILKVNFEVSILRDGRLVVKNIGGRATGSENLETYSRCNDMRFVRRLDDRLELG